MRIAVLLLAAGAAAAQDAPPKEAVQWSRWELALRAGAEPKDPHGAKIAANFRGPGTQRIEAPAFYSVEGLFRIRVALPSSGAWTWEISCDRPELGFNGRRGSVQVRRYTGANPLYRHGFLTARPGSRYLTHADGTPFLWIGDTAWYAGAKAAPEEWRDYLADRSRKKFSVVHISAVRHPTQPGAPLPFDSSGMPKAAYWENLDRKVKEANERGILILMVGLGRPNDAADVPKVATPQFARYVAARFFGDHVVFSPNFDGQYEPVFDTVAENLRAATSLHLITQHPNTRQGQNEVYLPKSYLSFSGLQSGHNAGRLEVTYGAAREWALNLWSSTPLRPVVNIEAMYDGRGNDEGTGWRERDARKLGWITWLSGALGYSYGAGETARKVPGTKGGVWGWNGGESDFDSWRKAVAWKSSEQMTVLRDFFASIEWWRLEPAHGVVAKPATSNQERAVFASAADRSFGVAYTPAGKLALDLSHFKGPVEATWVDPRSGARTAVPGRLPNRGPHNFAVPGEGEDWALLLRADN